jgi:hypothetical protein
MHRRVSCVRSLLAVRPKFQVGSRACPRARDCLGSTRRSNQQSVICHPSSVICPPIPSSASDPIPSCLTPRQWLPCSVRPGGCREVLLLSFPLLSFPLLSFPLLSFPLTRPAPKLNLHLRTQTDQTHSSPSAPALMTPAWIAQTERETETESSITAGP